MTDKKVHARIETRNTIEGNKVNIIMWFDAYEIKDQLKAAGYRFNGHYKTWEKEAVDFIDNFVDIVVDNKLDAHIAIKVLEDVQSKNIEITYTQETSDKLNAYVKAYFNL